MPNKCCVPQCRSNYKGNNDYVTMFSFPLSNKSLVEEWKKSIQRDFAVTKYSGVCIKHFAEEDIVREDRILLEATSIVVPRKKPRLVKDAVPSIFPSLLTEVYYKKERKTKKNVNSIIIEDNSNYSDFEDELILQVQKRDLLYNSNNPASRNRSLRQKMWTEISKIIGVPERECQRKWKSMRCRYVTGLRYKEAGNEITLNLLRKLDFLKHAYNRPSDTNFIKNHIIDNLPEDEQFSICADYSSSVSSNNSISFTPMKIIHDSSEIKIQPDEDDISCDFFQKSDVTDESVIEENDKLTGIQHFCQSIVFDLADMTVKEQKRVKYEIHKLLTDAKYSK